MPAGRPAAPALMLVGVLGACHEGIAGVRVPPPPAAAPAVHVQANGLVDTAGRPLRLRGVNRSGAEYACVQGWGIFDGPSDSASVRAIASWKANAVRVPLNETCWLGINGVAPQYSGAPYQKAISDFVATLNAAGLVTILDLHWSAAGTAKATAQDPMPNRDHTAEFWRQVATTFGRNNAVIFDLFNEPYPDNNADTPEAWRCWRDGGTCSGMSFQAAGMQELVSAVRGTGATNVILLGGVQYAAGLSHWLANEPTDPLHNVAASWHVYNFSWCHTRTCWDGDAAPVAQQVPLVLGELGEDDRGRTFVDSLMDWMDARQGSYLAWVWDTWAPPGDAMDLITSYDGTPSVYGGTFKARFASAAALVDPRATAETRALFVNLRRLAREHVMFGHQDDLAYGVLWYNEAGRSDVKETAGSYPAVYGWDVGGLERDASTNLDSVGFERQRGWIADGYRRGGVITLSWHMRNPASGGTAWDTTVAVPSILPGGARHQLYMQWLDRFADYARSLCARGRSGGEVLVPVVFRPFHETSGSWFWWGARHATPEQYRQLWRFTVEYLRDRKGVHNLLWAYSTDVFDAPEAYLERYPGDAYVDVLGFDDYQSVRTPATRAVFTRRLREVVELAEARGKVPALTETGVEAIPDSTWWTGTLLAGIKDDAIGRRIAWVLVWRNATFEREHRHHFFAPYPGQASVADFKRFRADPLVRFEDDLPDLYRPASP